MNVFAPLTANVEGIALRRRFYCFLDAQLFPVEHGCRSGLA